MSFCTIAPVLISAFRVYEVCPSIDEYLEEVRRNLEDLTIFDFFEDKENEAQLAELIKAHEAYTQASEATIFEALSECAEEELAHMLKAYKRKRAHAEREATIFDVLSDFADLDKLPNVLRQHEDEALLRALAKAHATGRAQWVISPAHIERNVIEAK